MLFRLNILTCILFFYSFNIQAQEFTFGNVSEEEVKMKVHPLDTNAAAVYLVNSGRYYPETKILQGDKIVYEFYQRIKILKNSGFDYANVTIPFISKELKIVDLKANCYNWENDKVVISPVKEANIIKETIFNDLKVKKLTFPSVKEGSVIEIFFKWTRDDVETIPSIPEWQFQNKIPTVWSSYYVKREFKKDFRFLLTTKLQGTIPLHKQFEKRTVTTQEDSIVENTWIMKDIPAFKKEPFSALEKDLVSKLKFATTSAWNTDGYKSLIDSKLRFYLNSKPTEIQNLLTNIMPLKSSREKVSAIYDYVGKNFKLVYSPGTYVHGTADYLFKHREGSPTELNALCMALMSEVGVINLPAYISTYNNGKINGEYLSPKQFDRLIPYVVLNDSSELFFDMAAYPLPLGILPDEDFNDDALIIHKDQSYSWKFIENTVPDRFYTITHVSLDSINKLKGSIEIKYTTWNAYKYRKALKKETKEVVAQSIFKNWLDDGKIDSIHFENIDSLHSPSLKGSFHFYNNSFISENNKLIYIQPLMGFTVKQNIFWGDNRVHDIDWRKDLNEIHTIYITLPPNVKIEELPKSIKISLPDNRLSYNYNIEAQNNIIKISSRLSIKRTTFKASEYTYLQKIYTEIIEKMNENIVLTKE